MIFDFTKAILKKLLDAQYITQDEFFIAIEVLQKAGN